MKEKFAQGDLVVFKGFKPTDETLMKVSRVNWKTTASGRMKGTVDAPFLESITVQFYDYKGNLVEKDVHSNEIIKAELVPAYYIQNAIELIKDESIQESLKQILEKL